jgi:uncharacterized membrane protein YdjX (TVP38/TMEM64 family)
MTDPTAAARPSFWARLTSNELSPAQSLGLFAVFTALIVALTLVLLPYLVVIGPWGYAAAFVINLLTSATVVIPAPGFAAVILMARDLDPFILGVSAGIGGTIGELSAYWAGHQGGRVVSRSGIYRIIRRLMRRHGALVLFVTGLMPFLPVDAAGLIAGATRYPIPKFLVYLGIGKVIMTTVILYIAAQAFEWAEPYLRWLG